MSDAPGDLPQRDKGQAAIHASSQETFESKWQQGVSCQHSYSLTEYSMVRRLATSQVVVIHTGKIVVNERVGVNQLQAAGRRKNGVVSAPCKLIGSNRQDGAKALASGEHAVTHGPVNDSRFLVFPREQTIQGLVNSGFFLL
jgi:hypothetical protein